MNISYSKNFIKQSKKLDKEIRDKIVLRIQLFNKNPLDYELNNHQLKGKFKLYRSINITGNYRALYLNKGDDIIFDIVGTHSQQYS
jgi:mRNA interferase YafQ